MGQAVGVIRWSRKAEVGEISRTEQIERVQRAAQENGDELVGIFEEPAVSGGRDLAKRPGLGPAIAMVEAREASTIYVAYFDRLVRSLPVQAEILDRVEKGGGTVFAVDVGEVSNGSAGQWLSASVLGLVSEYHRRSTGERTEGAKAAAIARGVPTFDRIPPGFTRLGDQAIGEQDPRALRPDPETAPIVRQAFELRATGASVEAVRAFLRGHGIERSFYGTQSMLSSRLYLGELRFGKHENLTAWEPIVPRALFERVQRLVIPRGRRPKSERLLARLGVLRCETCGARMVVGTARANGKDYPMYRCPPNSDCPRRVTISAELVEGIVVDEVRELLAGITGSANVESGVEDAERERDARERELDAAVRAFEGLEDVDATRERLFALRDARDAARDRADELRAAVAPTVTVSASGDWEVLTLDERRAIIRAVVEKVVIAPGRGPDRITVEPRLQ